MVAEDDYYIVQYKGGDGKTIQMVELYLSFYKLPFFNNKIVLKVKKI